MATQAEAPEVTEADDAEIGRRVKAALDREKARLRFKAACAEIRGLTSGWIPDNDVNQLISILASWKGTVEALGDLPSPLSVAVQEQPAARTDDYVSRLYKAAGQMLPTMDLRNIDQPEVFFGDLIRYISAQIQAR